MVGFGAFATVTLNRRHRHGAEEVEGRWAFELPTIGVLFEGEVKLLPAKDGHSWRIVRARVGFP